MHIHTKYKVSMFYPMASRTLQAMLMPILTPMPTTTLHDGQIMITYARLVLFQMSQKLQHYY